MKQKNKTLGLQKHLNSKIKENGLEPKYNNNKIVSIFIFSFANPQSIHTILKNQTQKTVKFERNIVSDDRERLN